MGWRRGMLIVLVFLPAIFWFAAVIDRLFVRREIIGQQRVESIGRARGHIVYQLDSDSWTTMRLPPQGSLIKLITNATIQREESLDGDEITDVGEIRYSIEYRALSAEDDVLSLESYHFRSRISQVEVVEGEETMLSSFYLDRDFVPTDSRTVLMDLSSAAARGNPKGSIPESEPIDRIELRMAASDPGVVEVGFRMYVEQQIPESHRALRWARMSRKARESVEKVSVFSLDLLSEVEQGYLASRQWNPLAPIGINGEDYTSRRMYTVRRSEIERVVADIDPAGARVDPEQRLVLGVPENGAVAHLTLRPIERHAGQETTQGTLRWFGLRSSQRVTRDFSVSGEESTLSERFDGGTLEVLVDAPVVLKYAVEQAGVLEPVEKTRSVRRGYQVEDGVALEYILVAPPDSAAVVRLHLWALDDTARAEAHASIECSVETTSGETLSTELLEVHGPVDPYARCVFDGESRAVSSPMTRHLRLPLDAARIVLQGVEGRCVAMLAVGSASAVREHRIPEDRFLFSRDSASAATWFSLRALNHAELTSARRVAAIVGGRRPPDLDPDILAGRYIWKDLEPRGRWSGRFLAIPGEDASESPEPAITRFVELPKRTRFHLELFANSSRGQVEPRLLYLKSEQAEDPLLGALRFSDGRVVPLELRGSSGQLRLPPMRAGEQTGVVEIADGVRVLINRARLDGRPWVDRRFVSRSRDGRSSFEYRKPDGEAISLIGQVFLPADIEGRVQLCARVLGPSPDDLVFLDDWTHRTQLFDLRADAEPTVRVLGGDGAAWRKPRRFNLRLGAELPPALWTLEFDAGRGVEFYLLLSEVRPGLRDRIRIETDRSVPESAPEETATD